MFQTQVENQFLRQLPIITFIKKIVLIEPEVMYMLGLAAGLATGIALLLALVFAEYSNLREKSEKAFTWIGAGAVSFILGGVIFTLNKGLWKKLDATAIGENGLMLFQAIGVILVIIGSVWALFDLVTQNM